ncbi:AIPR family protein, partial [Pontibacter rugosus]
ENHPINKESHIKVKFFQTKKESGFSANGFKNLKEGIEEIFNLELGLDKLQQIGANQDILDTADLIRKIFRKSSRERAKFTCEVYYVTAAPDINIPEKISHLQEELEKNNLNIPFEFEYWGAQKLLDLTERVDESIELKFSSQPLEIKERGVDISGFTGFISGNDLITALKDENGEFKSHLTEGNVRFFLGEDKKINSSIIESAKDPDKAQNFWAMNNGLTIIGDSIEPLGNNEYSVVNPQIVNGCQTVHCLYYAQIEIESLPDALKVFVKLVNTENLEVQTDIISATNSQNPVKSASLKANDNIQRNIEKYLKEVGIYYERRENYYKRQGYTGNKVIGLLKMAQIIHTVVNKESVVAINDASTLFESQGKYDIIFHDNADYDIYKFASVLYQKIWSIKNSDIRSNTYSDKERSLISKGGFVFLHIMSSLMMSRALYKFGNTETSSEQTTRIDITAPARKNEFTKRKKWLLEKLDDDNYLE